MATRLSNIDGENQRAKKGNVATSFDDYTLTTGYVDVPVTAAAGAVLDVGGAPWVSFVGTWTTGGTETVTLKARVSQDGTTFVDAPIVTAQTGSDGIAIAYPHEIQFTDAAWGAAATNYIPLEIRMNGWRFLKIQAKATAITGAPSLQLDATAGNES